MIGCDGQPVGYLTIQVQDKVAKGLWAGIIPERRGEGRYRGLFLAGLNESRARGAEMYDSYVADDPVTAVATINMHKNLGFVLVNSNLDWTIRDGERHEFTNHLFRISLMTIKDKTGI